MLALSAFSNLLRRPKEVTKDVEEGDVVLRRRDEPDLRLSRADRDAERAAAFAAFGRTFRKLAVHSPKALEDTLGDAFPWLEYATGDAVSGREKVCTAAAGNARTAGERITADPRERSERQHPLKGTLGRRLINGETLEQWQYEVTGAGRLWYCIDAERRIVWLTLATPGHPRATE